MKTAARLRQVRRSKEREREREYIENGDNGYAGGQPWTVARQPTRRAHVDTHAQHRQQQQQQEKKRKQKELKDSRKQHSLDGNNVSIEGKRVEYTYKIYREKKYRGDGEIVEREENKQQRLECARERANVTIQIKHLNARARILPFHSLAVAVSRSNHAIA